MAEIREGSLSELIPDDKNMNRHTPYGMSLIEKSIRENGLGRSILVDKDNRIIAGHGRVMAAKKLGLKKVPCVYIEGLTEEQYKAYILVDNKLTELGGWDFDLLNSELDDIDLDMSQFGFDIETDIKADTARTDLSDKIFDNFVVVIDCENEAGQESVYEQLTSEGYVCRLSI